MKIFNVLESHQVENLIDQIRKIEFTDGRATAKGTTHQIKNNFQITRSNPLAQELFEEVESIILGHVAMQIYAVPRQLVGLRVASYKNGGHYGWHVDAAHMNRVRTDLSFTLFLSDPDSYTGGELEMELGPYKTEIKANPGQLVVYSTGTLHRVKPVSEGERLVIVGWVNSHIPNAEDREALFKLNREITSLKKVLEDKTILNNLTYIRQYFLRRLSQ